MPHQRQSKQDLLFKFPEKKCKYCISSVHMRTKPKNLYRNQKDPFVLWFRQIANYKWTCIFWLLTPWDLFHKASLPNRPGLFQLVWLIVKWFNKDQPQSLCWKANLVQGRQTARLSRASLTVTNRNEMIIPLTLSHTIIAMQPFSLVLWQLYRL